MESIYINDKKYTYYFNGNDVYIDRLLFKLLFKGEKNEEYINIKEYLLKLGVSNCFIKVIINFIISYLKEGIVLNKGLLMNNKLLLINANKKLIKINNEHINE